MANQLKMAMIQAIIALLGRGWSYRRIARELGIHRETVARYDRLRRERPAKPAISTPGTASGRTSKPAISTAGAKGGELPHGPSPQDHPPGRQSHCEPHAEYIHRKPDAGLSAQRIFQDLRTDKEFTGSYSSVKRYVRRLGASTPLPFRRMECAPGAEAQVDFGTGPWVIEEGRRRRTHVFRITLSHSRKSYSEAVFRQTTEHFIRCLENAFARPAASFPPTKRYVSFSNPSLGRGTRWQLGWKAGDLRRGDRCKTGDECNGRSDDQTGRSTGVTISISGQLAAFH